MNKSIPNELKNTLTSYKIPKASASTFSKQFSNTQSVKSSIQKTPEEIDKLNKRFLSLENIISKLDKFDFSPDKAKKSMGFVKKFIRDECPEIENNNQLQDPKQLEKENIKNAVFDTLKGIFSGSLEKSNKALEIIYEEFTEKEAIKLNNVLKVIDNNL